MSTNATTTTRMPRGRTGPLSGIRVVDFCWMGVGNVATRLLGDWGAEVIKVENRKRLDTPRKLPIYKGEPARPYGEEDPNPDPDKGGLFNNYCRNKLGVTVDLKQPEGVDLVERLVGISSVITENFAPGVMERFGFTYDRFRELRPDVIYARMSGYGHSGPHHTFRSYGPVVQAVSGLSFISGLPDREPSGWGLSYMDNQAAYYNSAAILMAILHRNATGEGSEVDVSAVEVGVSLIGPDLLDATFNDRPSRRDDYPRGNRSEFPPAAPHGVYPSEGCDEWVAIAAFDDRDWHRLVEAMGRPDWASDERFASQRARHQHQDLLDEHVASWTRGRPKHEVQELLQGAGVAAAAVQHSQDLDERDPQLAERGIFFDMDHPVIGEARFEGDPWTMSAAAPDHWRSAPLLGEDNAHVFGELLGIEDDDLADLAERGVI